MKFIEIHKQATREQKLKDKLSHMQTWINELHYRMTKYFPPLKIKSSKIFKSFSFRFKLRI